MAIGQAVSGDDANALVSADGETWEHYAIPTITSGVRAMTYDGARGFIAVGNLGKVWESYDGLTWVEHNPISTTIHSVVSAHIGSLGESRVVFTAVVMTGIAAFTASPSSDLTTTENYASFPGGVTVVPTGSAYGYFPDLDVGRFIILDARSAGRVFYSDDAGVSWNSAPMPEGRWEGVAFAWLPNDSGNDLPVFVAAATSVATAYSTNGVDWTLIAEDIEALESIPSNLFYHEGSFVGPAYGVIRVTVNFLN